MGCTNVSNVTYTTEPTEQIHNGPCAKITYGRFPTSEVVTCSLPQERRPKPDDLILGITSRSPQSTLVQRASQVRTFIGNYTFWCNGVGILAGYSSYSYPMPNPPGVDSFEYPDWAGELRRKMQSDKVSLAESIGEWRETAKMANSAVGIAIRAVRAAKAMMKRKSERRRLRKWFNYVLGRPPGSRLELMDAVSMDLCLKFGIAPNIKLVEDSMQQLQLVKALKRRLQVTLTTTRSWGYGTDSVGCSLELERTLSCRAIFYVEYDVNSSNFTSGNIAESLWAGTPVSFMVDWFWNVGGYLSSFNAFNGVSNLRGTVTKRCVTTGVDNRKYSVNGHLLRPGICRSRQVEREAYSGLSLPFASIPVPSLPSGGDLGKLWSSIEVLLSLRRS